MAVPLSTVLGGAFAAPPAPASLDDELDKIFSSPSTRVPGGSLGGVDADPTSSSGGAAVSSPQAPATTEREWTHISATQLAMFKRCPNQYRERYVLGLKERPGAALIWGQADHKAHEHNFRQKIQSERDLPVGDVTDAFDQAWRDAIDQAGGESEVEWGRDDKPADLKTQAARLVELYHREASPLVQPTAVEHEFQLELPGVRLPIKGYIDVVTETGIVERKTGKRKVSTLADKPDWGLQGLIYATALGLPVFWHQAVKTRTPAVIVSGVHLDPPSEHRRQILAADVRRTLETIDFYMRTIGSGGAWPGAQTHPWACSFCGYRPRCFWWGT